MEEGDTMNLTCLVKDSPEPPQVIFWFHNEEEISYDSPRGGVSQITEKGQLVSLVSPLCVLCGGKDGI